MKSRQKRMATIIKQTFINHDWIVDLMKASFNKKWTHPNETSAVKIYFEENLLNLDICLVQDEKTFSF